MTRAKRHELRQQSRDLQLKQRNAKMAAAKFSFDTAKFYHEQNSLPGVMYWEGEYRRLASEAACFGGIYRGVKNGCGA